MGDTGLTFQDTDKCWHHFVPDSEYVPRASTRHQPGCSASNCKFQRARWLYLRVPSGRGGSACFTCFFDICVSTLLPTFAELFVCLELNCKAIHFLYILCTRLLSNV